MLELRPACEHCAAPLPGDSGDAMICTYECTFCRRCVDEVLLGVCPNCGGGFCPRPRRPTVAWVPGCSLADRPAARTGPHRPVDPVAHRAFAERVRRG